MYAVTCTGTNFNYGVKGKHRLIPNTHLKTAIREGWVYPRVTYAGWGSMRMGIKIVKGDFK